MMRKSLILLCIWPNVELIFTSPLPGVLFLISMGFQVLLWSGFSNMPKYLIPTSTTQGAFSVSFMNPGEDGYSNAKADRELTKINVTWGRIICLKQCSCTNQDECIAEYWKISQRRWRVWNMDLGYFKRNMSSESGCALMKKTTKKFHSKGVLKMKGVLKLVAFMAACLQKLDTQKNRPSWLSVLKAWLTEKQAFMAVCQKSLTHRKTGLHGCLSLKGLTHRKTGLHGCLS